MIDKADGERLLEATVPVENVQVGWIENGKVVFEQPESGIGVPVKVVLNYAELNLPDGEYVVRVVSCGDPITVNGEYYKDNCSNLAMSTKIYMKKAADSRTVLTDKSSIAYRTIWEFRVEKPGESQI